MSFLRRLFYKMYIQTSQIMGKNDVKQSVNMRWIPSGTEIYFLINPNY